MKKDLKICFASSSGGHFKQLMSLSDKMTSYDSFIVTEKKGYDVGSHDRKTYYLMQVNRQEWNMILKMLVNSLRSLRILSKEKPDVLITTGALAVIPLCILAKKRGVKLIYIESFARVRTESRTGKLLYKYADRFYVQWKYLLKFYPDAIYIGGVY